MGKKRSDMNLYAIDVRMIDGRIHTVRVYERTLQAASAHAWDLVNNFAHLTGEDASEIICITRL
jgi:hypothetical protein